MDALARALVELAARLELAIEGDIDPEFARELLEDVGARIDEAGSAEREALRQAAEGLRLEALAEKDLERAAFFERFGDVFGLTDS